MRVLIGAMFILLFVWLLAMPAKAGYCEARVFELKALVSPVIVRVMEQYGTGYDDALFRVGNAFTNPVQMEELPYRVQLYLEGERDVYVRNVSLWLAAGCDD